MEEERELELGVLELGEMLRLTGNFFSLILTGDLGLVTSPEGRFFILVGESGFFTSLGDVC